jgi:hypothetical protein
VTAEEHLSHRVGDATQLALWAKHFPSLGVDGVRDIVIGSLSTHIEKRVQQGNNLAARLAWISQKLREDEAKARVTSLRSKEIEARSPGLTPAAQAGESERYRIGQTWLRRRGAGEELPPAKVFIDEVIAGLRSEHTDVDETAASVPSLTALYEAERLRIAKERAMAEEVASSSSSTRPWVQPRPLAQHLSSTIERLDARVKEGQ